jgi:outer membrane protein TolC
MSANRFKIVGLLGLLVLLAWASIGSGSAVSPRTAAAGSNDAQIKALLQERHATLQEIASQTAKEFDSGVATPSQVREANLAVLRAELDLCDTDKERVAVLEKVLKIAQAQEAEAGASVQAGRALPKDALRAKADRLAVEIELERAKAR